MYFDIKVWWYIHVLLGLALWIWIDWNAHNTC